MTMTSRISVRSSSLRSRSVVVVARPRAAAGRARGAASARRSSSVSGAGRACSSAASLPLLALDVAASACFERAFQGPGDEPVLGLAGVELAPRALGLELGALDAPGAGRPAAPRAGPRARRSPTADAATPAGVTASRNAAATARSRRTPPSVWQRLAGGMQVAAAHAGIARDAPAAAGIGDLHPPPAAAAAQQALQQRGALARGAAALAARPHVRSQPLAGGQVLGPGHIAGMVLGQADGPLLDRQLDRSRPDLAVLVQALALAGAAEHERAGIGRVGQEVVHGAIAGARPAHAPLADRPPRQLLALADQLADDLARRPEPAPEREHARDRVTDLLVGRQHDPAVLVAVEPDRQRAGAARRARPCCAARRPAARGSGAARPRTSCPSGPSSSRSLKSAGE